jgi:hypothetical protein
MVKMVIEAGGRESRKPQDHGIYARGYQDLDGHLWEITYMDETAMQKRVKSGSDYVGLILHPSCRKSRIICSNCSFVISPFAYLSLTIDAASALC